MYNFVLCYVCCYICLKFLELQNRKILEELQLKKQMLLKQGVAPSLGSTLTTPSAGSASSVVNFYFVYKFNLNKIRI